MKKIARGNEKKNKQIFTWMFYQRKTIVDKEEIFISID